MRKRVNMLGGTLVTVPIVDDGLAFRAELPPGLAAVEARPGR